MDEEKLIALVRHFVFLYDTSHPKYMDSMKKDAAWNEISQLLNQPASACKHKWQGLRDAYRRAINKRKQRISEQPSVKIKKWKYEDEISYLNKYLSEKKKMVQNDNEGDQNDENISNPDVEDSYKNERDEIEQVENLEQYIVAMDPANFAHSQIDTSTVTITKNPQKWVNSQANPSSYVATNYSDDVIKEYKETEIAHDQMDLFFLSLSNTVKSFSPYLQAIAKNKIFNLVSELEIQQLTPAKSNTVPRTSTRPQTANWSTQQGQNSSQVCVKIENAHVD
ncbi:transcription factor Adf-1 [Bicyclus anynana]|uniref:Transcription factor Adf-1 n=1 Tax=Bicyclus anynana TaxID=110368 RepID=A0A6J1P340_BICAN|nr:transcription factor Adf-1 [Bicyclus anynana]